MGCSAKITNFIGLKGSPEDPDITPEGYATSIASYMTTKYQYYRRDHLGNNREVWNANSNLTLHRTQYYPSGLPWASSSGENIQSHPYKFNGCEFIEMHGLDVTDLGNRSVHHAKNRFDTMDRFCEKFPWQSPYVLAGNNPVNNIDVNGDSIWINHGTGFLGLKNESLRYDNGKLYNKDGSAYSGKVKGFLSKTVNSLITIGGSQEGGSMVGELQSSTNNFTIVNGDSQFSTSNKTKGFANQLQTDPAQSSTFQALQNAGVNLAGGSGGIISWNPSGALLPTLNGSGVNAITDLGHEMFHALDANRGLLDDRVDQGIKRDEWQAVYRENTLRSQLGSSLRTHYIKAIDANGTYIGGFGTRLLTPTNQPILPIWYKP